MRREVTELPWGRNAWDRPVRSIRSSTANTVNPLRDARSPLLVVAGHRIHHGSPGTSIVTA